MKAKKVNVNNSSVYSLWWNYISSEYSPPSSQLLLSLLKKNAKESSFFPAWPPRHGASACGRNIVSGGEVRRTSRLALEVRRRFIFLVRSPAKNILRCICEAVQVLTRRVSRRRGTPVIWTASLTQLV